MSYLKCVQCENVAMFMVYRGNEQIPLCVDHRLKFAQIQKMELDELARMRNYFQDQMEQSIGYIVTSPKIPIKDDIHMGDTILHNIKIENSNVGVVNTGSIDTVNAAINILNQAGEQEVANAIHKLTEAILSSKEATDEIKQEMSEILSFLSSEAVTPKDKRKSSMIRKSLVDLATVISGVVSLAQLWGQYGPVLENFFK